MKNFEELAIYADYLRSHQLFSELVVLEKKLKELEIFPFEDCFYFLGFGRHYGLGSGCGGSCWSMENIYSLGYGGYRYLQVGSIVYHFFDGVIWDYALVDFSSQKDPMFYGFGQGKYYHFADSRIQSLDGILFDCKTGVGFVKEIDSDYGL